jgi:malate dehydrogenase
MTTLVADTSELPKKNVIGQAGILDSSRFAYFISEKIGVSMKDIKALTLGSHGETMVPVSSQCLVNEKKLKEILTSKEIDELVEKTSKGGAEIVELLKTGSAYFAPASAAAQMVKAIILDSNEVLPVCAWMCGEYGISDVYLGVTSRIGINGVEEIVELPLDPTEIEELRKASESVKLKVAELRDI